jgi:hypothetical protein
VSGPTVGPENAVHVREHLDHVLDVQIEGRLKSEAPAPRTAPRAERARAPVLHRRLRLDHRATAFEHHAIAVRTTLVDGEFVSPLVTDAVWRAAEIRRLPDARRQSVIAEPPVRRGGNHAVDGGLRQPAQRVAHVTDEDAGVPHRFHSIGGMITPGPT